MEDAISPLLFHKLNTRVNVKEILDWLLSPTEKKITNHGK